MDPYRNIHKKPRATAKRLCSVLEERAAQPSQRHLRECVFHAALDALHAAGEGAVVVDIGCGTGALARDLASMPRVRAVVGIDPSPCFVAEAQRLASTTAHSHATLEFREGLGSSLPMGNESADLAVVWTVLCHVPEAEHILIIREAQRVLRPGGCLILADNDLRGWSLSSGRHDPLGTALSWYLETHIQDLNLATKFPVMCSKVGLAAGPLQVHTLIDSDADSYGYKHVLLRSIDSFASSGMAGRELILGMHAEAAKRVQSGEFQIMLPYAVCVAVKCGARLPDNPSHLTGEATRAGKVPTPVFGRAPQGFASSMLDSPPGIDANCDAAAFIHTALPALGDDGFRLPGEERLGRDVCTITKPQARARLICLNGIADISAKFDPMRTAAPSWLEVRLVDLPGHGCRAKGGTSTEGLPPCASPQTSGGAAHALPATLAVLVSDLVNDLQPLIKPSVADVTSAPYALLGFSFGAQIMYHVSLEIQRRGLRLPFLLIAAGRQPPHCVVLPPALQSRLLTCPDEGVLQFVQQSMRVAVPHIAHAPMRARVAALYRVGILLNSVFAGELPNDAPIFTSSIWDGAAPHYAVGVAPIPCPILTLSSHADHLARPHHVARWSDLVLADGAVEHLAWPSFTHEQIRDKPNVHRTLYARLALHLQSWLVSAPTPDASISSLPGGVSAASLPVPMDGCEPSVSSAADQTTSMHTELRPRPPPLMIVEGAVDACGLNGSHLPGSSGSAGKDVARRVSVGKAAAHLRQSPSWLKSARASSSPYGLRTRSNSRSPSLSPQASPQNSHEIASVASGMHDMAIESAPCTSGNLPLRRSGLSRSSSSAAVESSCPPEPMRLRRTRSNSGRVSQ